MTFTLMRLTRQMNELITFHELPFMGVQKRIEPPEVFCSFLRRGAVKDRVFRSGARSIFPKCVAAAASEADDNGVSIAEKSPVLQPIVVFQDSFIYLCHNIKSQRYDAV